MFTLFEISIHIWQRQIENPKIRFLYIQINWTVQKKVKKPRYRPEVAQRVPRS